MALNKNHTGAKPTKANIGTYAKFLALWLTATTVSITGMYAHLKFPKATLIKLLAIALPFCWVDWYFMTWAIELQHTYRLFTPTQDTMLLIATQFTLLLILNHVYLKQKVTRSDLIALPIILLGMYVSGANIVSKLLGWKIPATKPAAAQPHKLHIHHKSVALPPPAPMNARPSGAPA